MVPTLYTKHGRSEESLLPPRLGGRERWSQDFSADPLEAGARRRPGRPAATPAFHTPPPNRVSGGAQGGDRPHSPARAFLRSHQEIRASALAWLLRWLEHPPDTRGGGFNPGWGTYRNEPVNAHTG